MRGMRASIGALLLLMGALLSTPPAAAQDHLTAAQVDRFNALTREGGAIIFRYMLLTDREPAPLNTEEVRRGIALLDQAIEIYPGHRQTWWVKGKAFQALGDNRAAFEAFRRAYDIDSRQQPTINEMTIAAMEIGEFEFTLGAVRRGLTDFPDDLALRARLALVLLLTGEPQQAIEAADRALAVAPGDGVTMTIRQVAVEVRDGVRPQPRSMADLH